MSIGHLPFELVISKQPLTLFKLSLTRVAQSMKKNTNQHQREVEYVVGDWVLFCIYPTHKSLQI
ncbi:unnamed protein product [Spirodela intermedia]|uniref:Uncharacterized protein n=1 Tax=Spirodela intermedia TaxID=51605 RepID=A0A7I8K399_SPIIN|nr:unnamed protein product [Spirodela intermedia]